MTKRALVVGINDYSKQTARSELGLGWPQLRGCVNDANDMYHLLKQGFGFDEILTLTDLRATRSRILGSLRAMVDDSEPGDVVCFYYSGHGGLLPASSEASNTRFYEAIIPASGDWIFDRRLAQMADRLRPSEVNLTFIMDCCHSGGLHPADENLQHIPRSVPFRPDVASLLESVQTLIPCGACVPGESNGYENNVGGAVIEDGRLVDLDPDPNKTLVKEAKATLLSACQYWELAYESDGHGHLTTALLDTVDHSNFQASYEEVLASVRAKVFRPDAAPHLQQTPQLYGQVGRTDEGFLQPWNNSE